MKKTLVATLLAVLVPFASVQVAGAVDFFDGCDGISGNATCKEARQAKTTEQRREAAGQRIANIISGLLYIIGALAIIMIIYGGLRLLFSRGDSNGVQSGKNIILYAVIGLVIALLSLAIVNFVGGLL